MSVFFKVDKFFEKLKTANNLISKAKIKSSKIKMFCYFFCYYLYLIMKKKKKYPKKDN